MSYSVGLVVVFLLTNVVTVTACPNKCVCDGNVLTCARPDVPGEIPVNITKVFITSLNFENLEIGTFHSVVWENITLLDLQAVEGRFIRNRVFINLKYLQHLGLHGDDLWFMFTSVFDGLDKLQTLDLSNNYHLSLESILPTWDSRGRLPVLPSLENLTLSKLNSLQTEPLHMDEEFMRSLSFGRAIKFIDASYTNIGVFDYGHLYLLCDSIVQMKAHGIAIAHPKDFITAPNCESLRIFDITDTFLPVALQSLTFESMEFNCQGNRVYNSIETLIFSGILASDMRIDGYHLDMTECGFHMKKIISRRNNIKWFNISVSVSDSMKDSISEFDLSENGLEFLAPEAIYPDVNLQILRLSQNNLYEMQSNHWTCFERLLKKSKKLREFYIADNKLVKIPKHFFINNDMLEYIDMSSNRLQSLEFDIKWLRSLRHLDLTHNLIIIIDRQTYLMIDTLHGEIGAMRETQESNMSSAIRQQTSTTEGILTTHENGSYVLFQVNLGFNAYECSCKDDSYLSVEWLQSSESVYRENTSYVCEFQEKNLDILTSANTVIKTECAHQTFMNILKISVPIAVTATIYVALSILLVRRRKRIKQHYQDFLNALKKDNFDKTFLAFLSFCSEDSDFVMEHIYPQMRKSLSELTNTDKDFICIGDKEFRLGLKVHAEVMRCMEESSVVVFVVSKTFCTKTWCRMEVGEAYDQRKPMVMIMKEYVELSEMPKVLSRIFNRFTHASWVNDNNGGHLEPDIELISKSIIELARKEVKKNELQ